MLFKITALLLAGTFGLAQITSNTGVQFTCPAGDQAILAYSVLCPTSLTDGTTLLSSKEIAVGFSNAPASYKTSTNGQVVIFCTYSAVTCVYLGGAGNTLRLAGTDSRCPSTTINNGADPKPSGGGNYRKRAGMDIQKAQPNFVCPLAPTGNSFYLRTIDYLYRPNQAQPQIQLQCTYNSSPMDYFQCNYNAQTGVLATFNYQANGRCPSTVCPSAQYQQSVTRRAIAQRQVDPATLRARAPAPGEGRKVPRRQLA